MRIEIELENGLAAIRDSLEKVTPRTLLHLRSNLELDDVADCILGLKWLMGVLPEIRRQEAQHILKLVDAKVGPDFAKKVALDTIRQRIQQLSETPNNPAREG